jgi:hypothetical protein
LSVIRIAGIPWREKIDFKTVITDVDVVELSLETSGYLEK